MEDLLHKQQAAINGIQQIWTNFKKDSQERKNADYIKKRVEKLDSYWQEFQNNHDKLCMYEDRGHDYFVGNHYEETKKFYVEVRESVQKAGIVKPSLWSRQQTRAANLEGEGAFTSPMTVPEFTSRGTNSKFDEKLRKQATNFKAFSRTLANIDLSSVEEKWEFDDLLKTVENRWKAIDCLHWKIDSEFDETDESYDQAYTQHEQQYLKIKKEINRKLWSVSHREKMTPQLDIPTFTGNYQNWVSFKDLFTEAIHSNPCLSAAQKMQFLKGKIKGEPERLIQHLPISTENYEAAWEILTHRYNNKKLIFSNYMNTLLNIPVMQQVTSNTIKRVHDVACECLNGIKNLGIDIATWDPILVHLLSQKLESEVLNEYCSSLKDPRELPSFQEFMEFLENKFASMEAARRKQDGVPKSSNSNPNKQYFASNKATTSKTSISCPVCQEHHGIYFCKKFQEMDPAQKRKTISQLKYCVNCLNNHTGKKCSSIKRCSKCNAQHNTVLHDAFENDNVPTTRGNEPKQETGQSHVAQQKIASTVLLATAIVKVTGADGLQKKLRALIDQGSQISLITENAAQQLRLPRQKCKGVITGVGKTDTNCKGMLNITCTSLGDNYTFQTNVLIMKSLTRNIPNKTFSKPSWAYLQDIQLADPHFYISKPVDMLLGADVYANIIMNNIIRDDSRTPIAQETRLGYILFGEVQSLQCNVVLNNIEDIQRFWEIEDISENTQNSFEDNECIQLYKSTTTRLEDGRYQVRLPLKDVSIGESRCKAVAQFHQIERKFSRNNCTAAKYKAFLDEYLSLGHMKPALSNKTPQCYLPHHCVQRDDATTTSLRVVFNASSKTSNGISLNDCMHTGPNLQKDLLTLILRWRQHRVAFIADIEKMFRQIWVHEDDQNLQKIVWRDSPDQAVRDYQLTTVTYGTKAAPYLAMMTLRQLAHDERQTYPSAAQVVEDCFYMDDLLHGQNCLISAQKLQEDLKRLLKAGGFNLRKWRSNYEELLENIQDTNYDFKQAESTKTLGLHWNSQTDVFTFQSRIEDTSENETLITKRSLLSEISKLFDPLGWLTPISTKLKLLFQDVWKDNLQWDDKIPESINQEWLKIKKDIQHINMFKIPRWLGTQGADSRIELHGFCDASQKAYACVVYCKTTNQGQPTITLLAGKSKLVPCNKNISLPRLELSGAHLLSKLMVKVKESLAGLDTKIYGWTDSTAVLGWLQGDPDRWKIFVANRVRQIIKEIPAECWHYVQSSENPADCASRGTSSTNLRDLDLWWRGPTWLPEWKPESCKKPQEIVLWNKKDDLDKQIHVAIVENANHSIIETLLNKFSSFRMVVRVLAWVRRFLKSKCQTTSRENYLTVTEIRQSEAMIIKQIQQVEFEQDIHDLQKNGKLSSKSKILNLSPFLDDEKILRVGGRLQHANINSDQKHPIILPHKHRLTELLIEHAHKVTFHGGARVTLACIRQRYWIIGGNNATKKQIRLCIICKRQNPRKLQPLMGELPAARVVPSRPFMHTGVDFTGHILIKTNKGRGVKTTKGYVSVFVCMVTKAVHLELVSNLTTSAFIAAIRRMAARRGSPTHMYSDNGRNFLGASKVLQKEFEQLQDIIDDNFMATLADMHITWHFNAPSWPSAGGLWEAAVKSFKWHLKRVIGDQRLTYEEFATLLAQIEGCLNTRPLCALTEDPEDIDFLTPSHFLTGGPTLTLVETERDLRTRWQLTQKILQDLWKRWRNEYLAQLTVRSKWQRPQDNIKLDDIVIIHDDNLPPGKWAMGRVVELHPGNDGYVRVVTLKTKNGFVKRPMMKVSLLLEHKDMCSSSDQSTSTLQGEQIQQESNSDDIEDTDTSTRTTNKNCKQKRRKYDLVSIVAALMFLFTIISSSECMLNITPFRENQSLYFDKIANMALIREDWKVVVYYDMNTYWKALTTFESYIQCLKQTCSCIQDQVHCEVIVLQLRHAFSELEYYNQALLSQHSSTRSARQRRRRGLINAVGYVANSLFGVLDENFAIQYRKDISLMRNNEKHLLALWANQTSLIEAENNLLKRAEQDMNQQLLMVSRHMTMLQTAVGEMKTVVQTNRVLSEFNTGAIIASNMLYNIKGIQNTLLDTVIDIYNGRFNLHLITPEQLIQELSTISSKLPKDLSLPIDDLHTDFRKIYELLRIKTRMLNDTLIFEIKLPLICRDAYEIFRIIPIPKTASSDYMISVISASEYISMNMKKDMYILMSAEDIRSCLIVSEVLYCHILNPIYQFREDKNFCDTEQSECKTITRPCKNRWLATNTLNTYFYYCCDQCQVRTICDDQMSVQQLKHAGLINLGRGCVMKTNDFNVYSHKMHLSEMKTTSNIYAPEMAPINHIVNISISVLSPLLENKTGDIEQAITQIDTEIRSMKTAEVMFPDNISYHDIHHYAMIYALLGIVCIIGFIVTIRRSKCQWRVPPTPSPSFAQELRTTPTPPEPSGHGETPGELHYVRVHQPRNLRVDRSTSPNI